MILFHSALSLHTFLQPLIPIICISSSITSIPLFLGLPLFLLPVGFHSSTLLGILFPSIQYVYKFCFLLLLQPPLGVVFYSPLAGFSLLACEVSWSHTTTRHVRYDSFGRVISLSQRPLPHNTQHSQHTNIEALGRIRTHDRSTRASVDLRLRPRGYWERPCI